jgi:hypothetical protein
MVDGTMRAWTKFVCGESLDGVTARYKIIAYYLIAEKLGWRRHLLTTIQLDSLADSITEEKRGK